MRNMGEDKVNLSAKLIDPVVSKSFESLTSDDENERCNGGTALLEYMSKNADDQKVCSYNPKNVLLTRNLNFISLHRNQHNAIIFLIV